MSEHEERNEDISMAFSIANILRDTGQTTRQFLEDATEVLAWIDANNKGSY